jgi:hypothetical protein
VYSSLLFPTTCSNRCSEDEAEEESFYEEF